MNDIAQRIYRLKGNPREVGFALGRRPGERLARNIDRYTEAGPARHGVIDVRKLQSGALPWLRSSLRRFQEHLEGVAEGPDISLQRLARGVSSRNVCNGDLVRWYVQSTGTLG